jgi:hypothetical protein
MDYIVSLLLRRGPAKEVRLCELGPYLIRRWEVNYEELRHEVARQRVARGLIEVVPLLALAISVGLLVLRSLAGRLEWYI